MRAEPLVDIRDIDPTIAVDIRYATKDNFVGEIMYPVNRCLLHGDAARRLAGVQRNLIKKGLGLKVFDCYRPLSVQRKLWEKVPDEKYVANPAKGSRHNRGAAVDLTLVDPLGRELEMPSPYDEFGLRAHRSYQGGSVASRQNRGQLEKAMKSEGFEGLDTEWWHFDDKNWGRYPVVNWPIESIGEMAAAGQMIVVVTQDWEALRAKVYLLEREQGRWKKRKAFPAVVGRNGLGWGLGLHPEMPEGPQKKEGDLKAPAGVFRIGQAYRRQKKHLNAKISLKPTAGLVCVDDPNSRHYNKIVPKDKNQDWKSAEDMASQDLYEWLFVVEHNAGSVPEKGSCIFFHVWKNAKSGTAGCTASAIENLEFILQWLDPARNPLVIQLPEDIYEELQGIWNLPPL